MNGRDKPFIEDKVYRYALEVTITTFSCMTNDSAINHAHYYCLVSKETPQKAWSSFGIEKGKVSIFVVGMGSYL